jgi:hypothetical protein
MQRRFVAPAAAAACVIVLGALFAACSGGGSSKNSSRPAAVNTSSNGHDGLKVGGVSVESWGPTTAVPSNVQKAILAKAQTYVTDAVLTPLDKGTVGAGYPNLFDPGVRAAATTTDQNALTEAPIGKVAKYTQKATPVAITGLADGFGGLVYLAANFTVTTNATTTDGPATLARDVELTFAPQGKDWTVVAYRVHALRKLPTGTTTTVANAGAKP